MAQNTNEDSVPPESTIIPGGKLEREITGDFTSGDYGSRGDYAIRGDYGSRGDYAIRGDYGSRKDYGRRGDYASGSGDPINFRRGSEIRRSFVEQVMDEERKGAHGPYRGFSGNNHRDIYGSHGSINRGRENYHGYGNMDRFDNRNSGYYKEFSPYQCDRFDSGQFGRAGYRQNFDRYGYRCDSRNSGGDYNRYGRNQSKYGGRYDNQDYYGRDVSPYGQSSYGYDSHEMPGRDYDSYRHQNLYNFNRSNNDHYERYRSQNNLYGSDRYNNYPHQSGYGLAYNQSLYTGYPNRNEASRYGYAHQGRDVAYGYSPYGSERDMYGRERHGNFSQGYSGNQLGQRSKYGCGGFQGYRGNQSGYGYGGFQGYRGNQSGYGYKPQSYAVYQGYDGNKYGNRASHGGYDENQTGYRSRPHNGMDSYYQKQSDFGNQYGHHRYGDKGGVPHSFSPFSQSRSSYSTSNKHFE